MDAEAQAAAEAKAAALKAKEEGNAAYKAKRFDEAIGHYDRAIELDDTDISFLTNRHGDGRLCFPLAPARDREPAAVCRPSPVLLAREAAMLQERWQGSGQLQALRLWHWQGSSGSLRGRQPDWPLRRQWKALSRLQGSLRTLLCVAHY